MSERGRRRREALVAAAAGLLDRDGPQALSARAVAGEADVPLAAVSYYFDTVDDLVRAAAERLYDTWLAAAEALVAEGPGPDAGDRDLAGLLVRVWLDPTGTGPDPDRVRSLLVSVAGAARTPALAPRLRRYDRRLSDLVGRLLADAGRDPDRVRVLLSALDGFALARLCGVPLRPGGPAPTSAGADEGGLLAGLSDDVLLVLDDLAPVRGAQNRRAVGSSRPDSDT